MIEMIEWNEQRLEELVRKMGLKRVPGQGKTPIHLSLYDPSWNSDPLLTKIMWLDAREWQALGYDETDRVSVTRYLGGLGCRTERALSRATEHQQPLTLELAKSLIDAGACDKDALSKAAEYQKPLSLKLAKLLVDAGAFSKGELSIAAVYQHPLTLELAKFLIDAGAFDKGALGIAAKYQHPLTCELAKLLVDTGCDPTEQDDDGWDALICLACGGYPVDPQVTDLFLSAGCRTHLDGCNGISDRTHLHLDRILKEHAMWKENRDRIAAESMRADPTYGPDWDR